MVAEAYKNESEQKTLWAIFVDKIFAMADLADNQNLEIPRNIHLNERENSLLIEYGWFKVKYVLFLFIVPVCSYIVIESEYVEGSFRHVSLPVVLIFLVNVFIVYYCLTRLINTTQISVNGQRIKIRHQPLPLVQGTTIRRDDLIQLYVTKQMRTQRYNFYATTYQINAILSDKQVVTLVTGLADPNQGRFIERKIEQFLGITDIAVDGEIEKH